MTCRSSTWLLILQLVKCYSQFLCHLEARCEPLSLEGLSAALSGFLGGLPFWFVRHPRDFKRLQCGDVVRFSVLIPPLFCRRGQEVGAQKKALLYGSFSEPINSAWGLGYVRTLTEPTMAAVTSFYWYTHQVHACVSSIMDKCAFLSERPKAPKVSSLTWSKESRARK